MAFDFHKIKNGFFCQKSSLNSIIQGVFCWDVFLEDGGGRCPDFDQLRKLEVEPSMGVCSVSDRAMALSAECACCLCGTVCVCACACVFVCVRCV